MTRIKTTKKEVTLYTVAGKTFLDKNEALDYETDLIEKMNYVYHVVKYDPMDADSFSKDKLIPEYQQWVIYAVPMHHTPSNMIYDILTTHIGPAITKHIDEFECDYGYINNWDIRMTKRLYSIEALAEFFNQKISDEGYPTIRFMNADGALIEEWERDGVTIDNQRS